MRRILIDGNNYLFAAQHSGAKLTAGLQEVTAIFGFLGSLRNVMERFPGSQPIVLWDGSPSWRATEYPAYKANRDKNAKLVATKEALRSQRPIVKNILDQMGVKQFAVQGQEADDLAGFLSKALVEAGNEVILVTRDGDWQQLVRPHVIWFDHKMNKIITEKNFEESTGYKTPAHFLHGKAIQGDLGDNIPGVGGLGEGAAALIMSEFNSLDDLIDQWFVFAPKITKGSVWARYRKKIQIALDDPQTIVRYRRNLMLMELRDRAVPITSLVSIGKYDEAGLKKTFGTLGFHSILRKYDEWLQPIKVGLIGVTP